MSYVKYSRVTNDIKVANLQKIMCMQKVIHMGYEIQVNHRMFIVLRFQVEETAQFRKPRALRTLLQLERLRIPRTFQQRHVQLECAHTS